MPPPILRSSSKSTSEVLRRFGPETAAHLPILPDDNGLAIIMNECSGFLRNDIRVGGNQGMDTHEVAGFTSDLIRINTTNTGDPETSRPERPAAEYIAEKLAEVGYDPTYVESGGRGRGNVIVRIEGRDPHRPALLFHGHLDVVPADASEWRVPPFSGDVVDCQVWGRGAVDMKHMLAMMLVVARGLRLEGTVPPRDLIFAFVADEEAGGQFGAKWLIEHHVELFEGATEAIGEVGGFSVTLGDGNRAYLVETAEKGLAWLQLQARGSAGHASMVNPDNAVAKLAAAITRLNEHRFPLILTSSVRDLLEGVCDLIGLPFDANDPEEAVDRLGNLSRMIGATLRSTANVTMLDAGHKANVVPSSARATIDCRILPGQEQTFLRELAGVLGPDIEVASDLSLPSVQTSFDGQLVGAMTAAIVGEDPGAHLLPYMWSGGTDAKSFQELGIRHFGFTPLRLPANLDYSAMFHGPNERVPVCALEFGTRVLARLVRNC